MFSQYMSQEDAQVETKASQRRWRFNDPLLAGRNPDKSLGRIVIRIWIICFAIWGLIDVFVHQLPPALTKIFDSKPADDCWCGETDQQAVAMGCQYDHLAVDWLPPSCIDQALVDEFDMSGPGVDGAWIYYDPRVSEDGMSTLFVSISTNETDEFALRGKQYFATRGWHILHCMFTWRKQFRAWHSHKPIEPWNDDEEHIKHCSEYIMRTLEWHLSLDVIDTQILGGDRHRERQEKGNRDAATETQSVEEVPDYGGDAKKGRPENNVPPSVQVNPLFRIMRTGAQVLLEDMKSSDNGEPQQPNASRPPPFPYRGIAA
ncbi:uncharacterized protein MYCGRDRAFT_92695 [Zymoseptoria tritici IPO323]|uniref:Uncharacterized protein n=1 Tax=Zymoseptoria tritici (strain CBS 115943 / IPO323) TaxID=336722 RepID=F9X9P6_ZYMTI|nr:uncharacterized protein MYCGRDRAFT_92695 [Zymoseptoria tritici IPO323]EGP88313.1 hypothetical protein MYCGRDRAFT_92695 [Zymoseptoria tritici IPO323]